jgi:Tol biopolymer transport system component
MTLAAGTHLGPYQILALLGAGGMGEVYRARDSRLGREVAIKVLPAAFSADADRLRRFEQEARAAGCLNHPNILIVHDIGTHDGAPYIVSELLAGQELRKQLHEGPLPVRQALDYALQTARGLAAAHERGITHRDLKPENLFLTRDGRVKILDFGLAKLKPSKFGGSVDTEAPTSFPQTDPGVVMGTVGYMAPEQVRGEEADHRADIFAFGAILYEMLSGRRAFWGETAAETMTAILKAEPPELAEAGRQIAPGIERLVRHCLEKRPEERFQSAGDLGFALEALSMPSDSRLSAARAMPDAELSQTGTARWRRTIVGSRERWAWMAATILFLLTTLAALYFRPAAREAGAIRFLIPPPENTTYVPPSDLPYSVAVSPDGRRLAFVTTTEGKTRLWVRELSALSAQPLADTEGAACPFWSPDGRSIGFSAEGKLKRVEASGGPPQTLCHGSQWGAPAAWSRDGVILFASGTEGIFRVSADGGEATQVTKPDRSRGEAHHLWPQFLPDGRHFLFLVGLVDKEGEAHNDIYVGSLDSADTRPLLRGGSRAAYVPPGYLLYIRDGTLLARAFDAQALRFTGEPIQVAERLRYFQPTGDGDFSASEGGVLAYQAGAKLSRLAWFNRSGGEIGAVGAPGDYEAPRLSPDGQRVAVNMVDPRTGTTDIWIYELSRGTSTRFTFEPGVENEPIWSSDGRSLAFAADRGGPPSLVLKTLSDPGSGEQLTQTSGWVQFAYDWSPDGKFIIYADGEAKTGNDLWVLPLAGSRKPAPFLRTQFNEGAARFSPDGRWIAYVSEESGRPEVYVRPFQGAAEKWKVSNAGGEEPRWRRDGRELFYLAPDNKLMAVPVKLGENFEAGSPSALFRLEAIRKQYEVEASGQRFLASTPVAGAMPLPITVVVNWTADLGRQGPRGSDAR